LASFGSTNRRFKALDYLWVGVALLFHAMLLLMPFSMPNEVAPKSETISVTFVTPPEAETPEEQPVESELATTQPDTKPEKKPASITTAPLEPQEQVPEPLLDTIQALPKPVSAAQLLQSAADFNLSTPVKDKSLTLGAFSAPPLPANFAPSLKIDDNLFDGRIAMADSEIMDEWVDASGGYNVVVKLPSGRVLCGQAQPYSSMDPLVEHVTMWQSCGGDGKRKPKRRR